MSLKDTSIEERSIINSLAATSSFSAVEFLPPASFVGTLVVNSEAMPCLLGKSEGADKPKPWPHSRVN